VTNDQVGEVAIVWRGGREERARPVPNDRLRPVFDVLLSLGVAVEPVVYADAAVDEVRDQLLGVDGVLVWVDPISGGDDRIILDALLREVAERGVWVSAHPDTIQKIGTKEVLYRTRTLGWGTDTDLYTTFADFKQRFPLRLTEGEPRVLKQSRGNGGIGVWKVERLPLSPSPRHEATGAEPVVRIQHAQPRDAATEDLPLDIFMDRCAEYFSGAGCLVDQVFMPRLAEGMIRAYLVRDQVVGFARQKPRTPSPDDDVPPPDKVLGLPSAKTMYGPATPEFASLKSDLEQEWVPALRALVDLDEDAIPMLWDADFLYGPNTGDNADSYVLCEINVSSVSPFPAEAINSLASAVHHRLINR
jgi:hypothetical protein